MTKTTYAILLVDDDKSWQHINKIVLGKFGFHMDTASTKDEALEKIQRTEYEIAVIDLRLVDEDQSNFDGIEIIKELYKKHPNTRVLVKSGYLSSDIEIELKSLGIGKENIFDKATTNKELAERINKIHQEIKPA